MKIGYACVSTEDQNPNLGHKFKLSPQQVAHARKLIKQGECHNTVAQSLNVSRRTLYRALQR